MRSRPPSSSPDCAPLPRARSPIVRPGLVPDRSHVSTLSPPFRGERKVT